MNERHFSESQAHNSLYINHYHINQQTSIPQFSSFMSPLSLAAILGAAACVIVGAVYPFVLRYAIRHNIVDNPNARKLQRTPVPVLGGMAVFGGVLPAMMAMMTCKTVFDHKTTIICLCGITIMLAIGIWDDRRDISATFRFFVEILVVVLMLMAAGCPIDNFHGLWGIWDIPWYLSWPLSVVAGVGIINAINLIDGVNGYSSGYVILASLLFATYFFYVGDNTLGCIATIGAGALIPFYLHNVFGAKSKMFIGDGGTLMMGTAVAFYVAKCLTSGSGVQGLEANNFGIIAFTLAVLNIPVFDTLRVMSVRMIRGLSPFHPDKTHLHHLFIEMGFSHSGTTTAILSMNMLTVLIWFLSWKLGAAIDTQTYLVALLGIFNTFVFYKFMKVQAALDSRIHRFMLNVGAHTHIGDTSFWKFMRRNVDRMS